MSPPDWSPDGSLDPVHVHRERVSTSPPCRRRWAIPELTSEVAYEAAATWSPDGSSIAYKADERSVLGDLGDERRRERAASPGRATGKRTPKRPSGLRTEARSRSSEPWADLIGAEPGALYVVDVATGDVTEVLVEHREQAAGSRTRANWMPDGDASLVLTENSVTEAP